MNKNSIQISKSWNNLSNANYYNTLAPNDLFNYAVNGGLSCGCDVELISNYIKKANAVLEIGAAYGRVIEKLKVMGYNQRLVAIERCSKFHEQLVNKYSSYIEIAKTDIQNFTHKDKFCLILWLWSGLCDFSKLEQIPILKKVIQLLNRNGVLVLDTLSHTIKPSNAIIMADQSYVIPNGNISTLYGYTPSCEELDLYAKELGLKIRHQPYKTKRGRDRILHFMGKKNV